MKRYTAAKQEHVFAHYASLSDKQKQILLNDAENVNPKVTNNLYKDLILDKKKDKENASANLERIEPELVLPADNVS